MPNVIMLENFSFNLSKHFDDFKLDFNSLDIFKIRDLLKDKIISIEFINSEGLFDIFKNNLKIIEIENKKKILSNEIPDTSYYIIPDETDKTEDLNKKKLNIDLDICYYNSKKVIFMAYVLNDKECHEKVIFFSRKILDNDTYNFYNYESFIYNNITLDEISQILYRRYILKGIKVKSNGIIENIDCINININDEIFKLIIKNNKKIKELEYLNSSNSQKLYNISSNDKTDKETEESYKLLKSRMEIYNIKHISSNMNLKYVSLNIITSIDKSDKNDIISNLLNTNIFGDCYVFLENIQEINEKVLYLNKDIFNKIYKNRETSNIIIKNDIFFNIYKELN